MRNISRLGFYAVTPGTPEYEIGMPHFDDVSLMLLGGKVLHIEAHGRRGG
jgi:putative alpha-1,2-mannosidase